MAKQAEATAKPVSALYALAERAADKADYDRVVELFGQVQRAALSSEEAVRWQRLLREAGASGAARELAGVEGVAPAVAADDSTGECDDVLDFDTERGEPREEGIEASIIATFLRWFGGRRDVYARQWYDARRDRGGYWPVRRPLDEATVEAHLLARVTVGQYVVHPGDTVSFAALDLDPGASAYERIRLDDSGTGGLALPAMREYAERLLAAAHALDLPMAAEDTGGSGLHLWLFFVPRLPAARAQALLREILWRAGPQPPAVGVEVFPKQNRLSGKGLGNLIKLPLGVHQSTQRRSCLLDAELRSLDAIAGLAALRPSPPEAIEAALHARVVPLPGAGGDSPGQAVRRPRRREVPDTPPGPTPRGLALALARLPAGRAAEQGADRMLAGCAVLRELTRHAFEDRVLGAEEARALLYSVGLAGRENERIESMFAQAGVSRKELERVRRGLQGPVGCRRLHERFPQLAAVCTCPQAPEGGYATPALFAFEKPPPFASPVPPAALDEPLPTAGEGVSLHEIERRLERIEQAVVRIAQREPGACDEDGETS